jgi:ABC-type lipoprotein export system ATPase subunit
VPEAIEAVGLLRIHPSTAAPVAALRGLDMRIEAGELAAVVGPSGSGKSTLLRILAGEDRPSAGRLTVLGVDLSAPSAAALERHRRDRVGTVEQHYRRALSPHLRVGQLVALPLAVRGVPARARRARASELLGRIGLADREDAFARSLSGGEQQRVAVAAALATRPPLLLADEPTGELDRFTAAELLTVLRELVADEGTTCVVVTHDADVVEVADRVVHLEDGRAVAETVRPGDRRRAVDSHGWLAPPLREPAPPPAPAAAAPSTGVVARLDGASRSYAGRVGLPATTAAFTRGGFHVVSGPSGSGKSTLLRLLIGLDRPTAGRVETLGRDLGTLDRDALARLRATGIGLVDQQPDLVPFLSARENVELGLAVRGRAAEPERAHAALDRLGIGHLADRSPSALSAGERLRVALARAVVAEPEILILDEPTAALDRSAARDVGRLLAGFGPTMTVIAATHDEELIDVASDRLALDAAR